MRIRLPGTEIFCPEHAVPNVLRGMRAYCECGSTADCIEPYSPEVLGIEGLALACGDCCEEVHKGVCRSIVEEVVR
jgi:hypothetical protein